MRSLKFRAWDIERKTYDHEEILLAPNGDLLASRWQELREPESEYIIEQYTGLKDKNGKEIYEGDILQEKGLLSLTCLEWNKNNARYMTRALDESKHVSTTFYFDIITALECEVVGNIHENPELLEKKDAKD